MVDKKAETLEIKVETLETTEMVSELGHLRTEIDKIDKALLSLLSERFKHAVKIAEIKSKQGLELYDPEREAFILRQLALQLDDHESLTEVVSVFEAMLLFSKKAQAKHLEGLNGK